MLKKSSFEEWAKTLKPEYQEALKRGEEMTPANMTQWMKERADRLKLVERMTPEKKR